MECLGLYNKPKAEVHLGHKLTGPKEEERLSWEWSGTGQAGNRGALAVHLWKQAGYGLS